MYNQLKKFSVVIALLATPAASQAQGFFSTSESSLNRAHEAYLKGDFRAMSTNMRQTLEDYPNDPIVKENVLDLLSKSYDALDGASVPVDWSLPAEVKQMNIGVKRTFRDEAGYSLRINGGTVHPKTIAQLQVIQFPDQVVLDKQAGVGNWSEDVGIDPTWNDFNIQTKRSTQPVAAGLYLLNMTLTDGTQTKGWFILGSDLSTTASPRVLTPTMDQIFTTGNPTFTWDTFVSSQYKPYERRSLWIGIARSEPPKFDWNEVWGHFESPPTTEQLTVGSGGDKGSVTQLDNGHYVFYVDYHERHKFGDVNISRDSQTIRPFQVAK